MTPEQRVLVRSINKAMNDSTVYKTDYDQYMKDDWWSVAQGAGDCEDFALAKFRRLREAGIPLQWLRLATCYVEDGGYHAVLLVDDETQRVTWVLDNRFPDMWPHTETYDKGYRWHKLQIAGTSDWEIFETEVKPVKVFR